MGVLVRRVFEALVKGSPWGSIVLSLVSQCSYACFSSVNKNVSEGIKYVLRHLEYSQDCELFSVIHSNIGILGA